MRPIRIDIEPIKRAMEKCPLPHTYFLTYDFQEGERQEQIRFATDYVWNAMANHTKRLIRVWAVGFAPIGKRDHFHGIFSTSKPFGNHNYQTGPNTTREMPSYKRRVRFSGGFSSYCENVPLMALIDDTFAYQHGRGKYHGAEFIGAHTGSQKVKKSEIHRVPSQVPMSGVHRYRFQLQEYDSARNGLWYVCNKHNLVTGTFSDKLNDFIPSQRKRRRAKRY